MPLTEDNLARISKMRNVTDVVKYEAEGVDPNVFPQSPGTYPWNADNFGPLWIPSKGATATTDRRKPAALSPHHRNLRRQ
ncbi:MAG: hypothetical protein ACLR8Y_19075 [Alistipes indistinctus]